MISFDVSLFIVAAFLVLTLLVGIYFSRKKTTFREYAVGDKQFATATIVATVLATFFTGGGMIRNVEQVYAQGLYWILFLCVGTLNIWIYGRLALRMGPFMHHLSITESIGSIYGRFPRIITALFAICSSVIKISVQIIIISRAIGICMDKVDPQVITILATLILIFYSTFGGVRAVALTDVFQLVTFTIIIPILAWFMFQAADKSTVDMFSFLQSCPKFQFSSIFQLNTKFLAMLSMYLTMVPNFEPSAMQRVYMSSDPIQARRVFKYTTLFYLCILFTIALIGLFVFVGNPDLPLIAVWSYIMGHIPSAFKGCVAISLLAMAMSTADSCLNSCSVIINHDILESLRKATSNKMWLVKLTTFSLGIFSMVVAFFACNDLLAMLMARLDLSIPIITAPFLLALYGFRSTSRTALIGMASGILTISAWKKWVEPSTGINGAFIAMLANGLAMMASHYLLKQPEGAGWVGPGNEFIQMQQERARKRSEQKESIKNAWANRKNTLEKLIPSDPTLYLTGLYMITTAILSYCSVTPDRIYWAIGQAFLGAVFIGSKTFFSKVSRGWFMGLGWLIGLAVYLPLNLLWYWWHSVGPIFTTSLSLAHCTIILWVLPLYLGIGVVAATSLVAIYPITTGLSFPALSSLFPLFITHLLVLSVIILFKVKQSSYKTRILYFEQQQKIRENQKLKASLYEAALVPSNRATFTNRRGYGFILNQVVRKIEESISFLDSNMTLYKEDFQSIINKLYDWVAYFNRKETAKYHALIQPNKITLDKLIRKVEVALAQEVAAPPRLLVEKITDPNRGLCTDVVCDINQVVYLLVQAVLRVGKLAHASPPVVRIQLYPTALHFTQADPIDSNYPTFMEFQATALVISQSITDLLPKVKAFYADVLNFTPPEGQQKAPPSIDLQQQTISTIIGAHYGYVEASGDEKQPSMLLVLPNDVTEILGKMTTELPIDCLTSEAPVTPKEQADSMMVLMQFHDYVCKSSHEEDPIDIKTISGLLLLLRQHFGFKRHASGQLFYVRAVGIAQLVVEWVFHSPKVIYASLLYGLVRRTCLPLSYVKEHYNLGVYAFVSNVVKIDKREALDHTSLLYVKNRLEKAIKEDHVQLSVLFIKLAERLYDLRHAAGYIHLTEVQHMAQETLSIDVQIANAYLGPEIGVALEEAARQALKICKDKENSKGKDKDS